MFSISEYEYLLSDYTNLQKEKMKKHKIISVLAMIVLLITVGVLYALGLASEDPANILIPVYFGASFIALLIYLLISFGSGSSRIFYDLVVEKVIEKINFHLDVDLKYSTDRKTEFTHNKNSWIFTTHARARIRMYLKGMTSNDIQFELYDLTLTSGSGNNQQTHLNGIYIVLKNDTVIHQQIRTHGKPRLKGTDYRKIESDYEHRVYLKEELNDRDLIEKYKDIFSSVMDDSEKRKGYLSVIEKETHFALHPFKLYKNRKFTLESMNTVYAEIKWLIELVDKLSIEEY